MSERVDVLAPHRREVASARKAVDHGRRVTLIPGAMERRERELAEAEARLAAVAELIAERDALRAALVEYPNLNPHQLQARKVCAGVVALAMKGL